MLSDKGLVPGLSRHGAEIKRAIAAKEGLWRLFAAPRGGFRGFEQGVKSAAHPLDPAGGWRFAPFARAA
ncbi:hypothetical protein DFP88_10732 [Pseudoroseicyclus aestuarii]|uniref:Uncharacterized protein n=1 Tax=Pseudoroseicyclus aestuarii TaxID=1795041 RepID=A0A318SN10_9RHOB|nr:hypothetical protein DFP88_10732 [Pseudoroseicyclus aestuarii]